MAALSDGERAASDRSLFARFLALPGLAAARTVFLFYGVGAEPETALLLPPFFAMGKTILLPRCLPKRQMEARVFLRESVLTPSAFGIPEPGTECTRFAPDQIDLILVPALCYDQQRYRLGQGGGYYDRYLAGYRGVTVGLCRDAFLQERLPLEETDLPVGCVLTETQRF